MADAVAAAGWRIITPEQVGRLSLLEAVATQLHGAGQDLRGWPGAVGTPLDEHRLAAAYSWTLRMRPYQFAPGAPRVVWPDGTEKWSTWLDLGGRGAGKTFAGAYWVQREAELDPDGIGLIVGPTYGHIKQHQLFGPSGIMRWAPPWARPQWRELDHLLVWPNGFKALCVPAVEADKFRGGGYSVEWGDEIVAWKGTQATEVWQEMRRVRRYQTPRMKRLGLSARTILTTSPAPTPIFRELLNPENGEKLVVTRATTLDNADNLDPAYVRQARRLIHTTIGKREFGAELVFDLDPCLFRAVNWDALRVARAPEKFDAIWISVDPATGEKQSSDMHGIVVEGVLAEKRPGDEGPLDHTYVLEDLSLRDPSPTAWATAAVQAWRKWRPYCKDPRDCRIFAETNTGGSMVKGTIRQVSSEPRIVTARARNSKAERAAPVTALCEAGLVHLVGHFQALEQQLSSFTGAEGGHARDDRADAFVWPLYKFVCRSWRNRGALEAKLGKLSEEPAEEQEETG